MAVGIYKLPVCDGCKLPWLPVGWTQDSNPRNLPAGTKPLRCGKCKSPNWDREFVKQSNEEPPALVQQTEEVSLDRCLPGEISLTEPAILSLVNPRCRHRMTNCPICHSEAAQDA